MELVIWGVRYQVKDVQRAITFYTQTLGFNLDMQNLPAFGQVSIWGPQVNLERSRGNWVPTNARWPSTRGPADGTVRFFRSRICLRALLT